MIEITDNQGLRDFLNEERALLFFDAGWSQYAVISKQMIQFVETYERDSRGIKFFYGQFEDDRVPLAEALVAVGVPKDSFTGAGSLSIFQKGTHLRSLKSVIGAGTGSVWQAFDELFGSPKPVPLKTGQYAVVNGLRMYYEINGRGMPLVLIHGGGSTITSTFGRIRPKLVNTHRVIAVELQAHGRTADIDRPLSFEQDADDVASLLQQLQIHKVDLMGFSNGGTTCLQIAIRHPRFVNKLVLASAAYKRDGMQPGSFEGLQKASLDSMPQPLKDAYLEVNPDPKGLQAMFDRDVARMLAFQDIPDADIRAIQASALVINGDADVVRIEHALELSRTLPHGQLAILPGGHGDYIGEICAANSTSPPPATAIIERFLGSFGDGHQIQ